MIFLAGIFLVPPILVFSVKPTAPMWLKSGRLLLPIFLLALFLAHTSDILRCFHYKSNECWKFHAYFIKTALLQYIMYIGWFEYIWRKYHKQDSLAVSDNIKYGIVSSLILAISLIMTLTMLYFIFNNFIGSLFF